jgi:hypothetical protein
VLTANLFCLDEYSPIAGRFLFLDMPGLSTEEESAGERAGAVDKLAAEECEGEAKGEETSGAEQSSEIDDKDAIGDGLPVSSSGRMVFAIARIS